MSLLKAILIRRNFLIQYMKIIKLNVGILQGQSYCTLYTVQFVREEILKQF